MMKNSYRKGFLWDFLVAGKTHTLTLHMRSFLVGKGSGKLEMVSYGLQLFAVLRNKAGPIKREIRDSLDLKGCLLRYNLALCCGELSEIVL